MAIATAYRPLDMFSANTWTGDVTLASAVQIQITAGTAVQNYYGSFRYINNALAGGIVSRTDYYEDAVKVYEISDGSYNAKAIKV